MVLLFVGCIGRINCNRVADESATEPDFILNLRSSFGLNIGTPWHDS